MLITVIDVDSFGLVCFDFIWSVVFNALSTIFHLYRGGQFY
jgi:hypothetical protein